MVKYIFEELVIGTKNPAKVERFQKLLKNVAKKVSGVLDFNIDSKPKETGKTSGSVRGHKKISGQGKDGHRTYPVGHAWGSQRHKRASTC